jgi:prepilin-type N-terminal cleavage/methylation domain-containing protein
MGNSPTNRIRGFTILEIVVVLGIIGILAAIAIPFYSDYTTRARVTEAFEFSDSARTKVHFAQAEWRGISKTALNLLDGGKKVDMMTGLDWRPLPAVTGSADAAIGYILPTVDLPGIGIKHPFALELTVGGTWRCVGAGKVPGVKSEAVLEAKYLPASCRDGAIALTPPPGAPQGCPAGTRKAQAADVNGVMHDTCEPIPAPHAPIVQPTLTPEDCSSRGLTLGADGRCRSEVKPLPLVPAPAQKAAQVTGKEVSKATLESNAGGGDGQPLPVSAKQPPSGTPQCVNGKPVCAGGLVPTSHGCMAKGENWASHPDTGLFIPQSSAHLCRGPKFICERSHRSQPCQAPSYFAINDVENLIDGSRYVTRRCGTYDEAVKASRGVSSDSRCAHYNVHDLQDAHFSCSFACAGKDCNVETVPRPPFDPKTLKYDYPVWDACANGGKGDWRKKDPKIDPPDSLDVAAPHAK